MPSPAHIGKGSNRQPGCDVCLSVCPVSDNSGHTGKGGGQRKAHGEGFQEIHKLHSGPLAKYPKSQAQFNQKPKSGQIQEINDLKLKYLNNFIIRHWNRKWNRYEKFLKISTSIVLYTVTRQVPAGAQAKKLLSSGRHVQAHVCLFPIFFQI